MGLKACSECGREISSDAASCPQCGKKSPHGTPHSARIGAAIVLLIIGTLIVAALGSGSHDGNVAKASVTEAEKNAANSDIQATSPHPAPQECRMSMPGSTEALPVFPTEDGLHEYISAAVSGDSTATDLAFDANHGFLVPSRTRCFRIDVGITATKVRVLEGPHMGEVGWLPTEFTRGG
jgi:hypothetical protein